MPAPSLEATAAAFVRVPLGPASRRRWASGRRSPLPTSTRSAHLSAPAAQPSASCLGQCRGIRLAAHRRARAQRQAAELDPGRIGASTPNQITPSNPTTGRQSPLRSASRAVISGLAAKAPGRRATLYSKASTPQSASHCRSLASRSGMTSAPARRHRRSSRSRRETLPLWS